MVAARFKAWQGLWSIEAGRSAVAAATDSLSGLAGSMFAVGNAELGPFFRQVDDLSRQVEAARVAILAEALSRGWWQSPTPPA